MDVLYPQVLTNSTCSRSAGRMQAGITVLYWVRTFVLLRSLLMSDNVDPNAKEDTYTALDPVSRSSDDVYNTLANVDPNAKDDTYTALDPVSRSSDDVYNTLATVHSSPSDDLYSALDPQSRSPEYDTLAVSESTCTDECFVAAGTDGL
ncbi:hypothetical protein MHYP_G00100460 [Metynnis hypsauchen]